MRVLFKAWRLTKEVIPKTLDCIGGFQCTLLTRENLNKLTSSSTFSSCKIREEIGFKPKYDLYNTMNETIESYRRSKSKI